MKIDALDRLFAILPRDAGNAMEGNVTSDRYCTGYDVESTNERTDSAKTRSIQSHVTELYEINVIAPANGENGNRKTMAIPEYDVRDFSVLSYFLHSQELARCPIVYREKIWAYFLRFIGAGQKADSCALPSLRLFIGYRIGIS